MCLTGRLLSVSETVFMLHGLSVVPSYLLTVYLVGVMALPAQSALAVGIIKAWDSHTMLPDTFCLEVNEMARRHPIDQQ